MLNSCLQNSLHMNYKGCRESVIMCFGTSRFGMHPLQFQAFLVWGFARSILSTAFSPIVKVLSVKMYLKVCPSQYQLGIRGLNLRIEVQWKPAGLVDQWPLQAQVGQLRLRKTGVSKFQYYEVGFLFFSIFHVRGLSLGYREATEGDRERERERQRVRHLTIGKHSIQI